MIHFAIGTKAQLIKTTPLMRCLDERGIEYRYIDLGGHAETTRKFRAALELRDPDAYVTSRNSKDVATLPGAVVWSWQVLWRTLRNRRRTFTQVFGGSGGVCVVHGDTLSTLFGLLAAKRAGIRVVHLESGLRSRTWLHPFPEEIIRLLCMRFSDDLVASTDWAYENLLSMGYTDRVLRIHGNTGAEAFWDVMEGTGTPEPKTDPYALVCIHRFETIMSRSRLSLLVNALVDMSPGRRICFVLHEPTHRRLARQDLLQKLRDHGVELTPLSPYPEFLRKLRDADFVVTDGGSVQEECSYLGTPCFLFRKRTERQDGLGQNVVLGGLDSSTLLSFAEGFQEYRTEPTHLENHASKELVDILMSAGYAEDSNGDTRIEPA